MAETIFETRGHVLYKFYLDQAPNIDHYEFIFSIGQPRNYGNLMKYYTFSQNLSRDAQTEYDLSMANDGGRKTPGRWTLAVAPRGHAQRLTVHRPVTLGQLIPKWGIKAALSAHNADGNGIAWVTLALFDSSAVPVSLSFKMKKKLGVARLQQDVYGKIIRVPTEYARSADPWTLPKGIDANAGENPDPH